VFTNGSAHDRSEHGVIVKGLGWELAYAAYRKDWQRLAVLYRWLGAAAANVTLYREQYNYDCIRLGQYNWTRQPQTCWGDTGNGEQIGWFVWGSTVAQHALRQQLAMKTDGITIQS
jgi:hypothetical protein